MPVKDCHFTIFNHNIAYLPTSACGSSSCENLFVHVADGIWKVSDAFGPVPMDRAREDVVVGMELRGVLSSSSGAHTTAYRI